MKVGSIYINNGRMEKIIADNEHELYQKKPGPPGIRAHHLSVLQQILTLKSGVKDRRCFTENVVSNQISLSLSLPIPVS